jgi:hypothetical protein
MEFNVAFDPFRAIRASWAAVKQAPLPLLLGGILLVMTTSHGGGVPFRNRWDFDRGEMSELEKLLPVFLGLGALVCCIGLACFLFSSWLEVGFQNTVRRALETGEADAGELFDARGRFWDMVLVRILALLATFASALPMLLVAAAIGFVAQRRGHDLGPAWVIAIPVILVLILPVAYVLLGLSLVTQAVALEGKTPLEAMRRSWSLVAGHRLWLLLYWLVLGVLMLSGLCACCVGVLVTGSLARIAAIDSYLALTRGTERPGWWIETRQTTARPVESWGTSTPPPPPPAPPPPPLTPPTA